MVHRWWFISLAFLESGVFVISPSAWRTAFDDQAIEIKICQSTLTMRALRENCIQFQIWIDNRLQAVPDNSSLSNCVTRWHNSIIFFAGLSSLSHRSPIGRSSTIRQLSVNHLSISSKTLPYWQTLIVVVRIIVHTFPARTAVVRATSDIVTCCFVHFTGVWAGRIVWIRTMIKTGAHFF